jgi:hypothetical protein
MKKLKQWFIKKILAVLESEEAKELAIKSSSLLPENIQKNREKIYDFLMEYYKGTIEKQYLEPALKTFFSLQFLTEKQKEDILKINMEVFLDIKKDSDFTNDEFDIYREIINYIHSNRQKEVKILLKKAAKKINNQELYISKETIDFITSITDEKLETLKKIFRYVVGYGILKYKDIEQDFMKMGFCQPGTDNIKFLGRIFVNQDAVGGKAYNNKIEAIEIENIFIWKDFFLFILNKRTETEEDLKNYLSNEENKNEFQKFLENDFKYTLLKQGKIKFYITKQPTRAGSVEINIGCFAILTDVGVEMYSLLKDEIENYPTDYLEAIIKDEQYKNFGLVYEITA